LTSNFELVPSLLPSSPSSSFAAMAPKRKATDASDGVAPSPYHANVSLYPEADLVVESSDKILFATRALHLRSASSLFDDILSLPPQEDREKKDGHPLIKIDEEGELFEIFLRYAHRGRLLVEGQPPQPDWDAILLLSKRFDKYDSPDLARSFLIEHLPKFIMDPSVPAAIRGEFVVAGTNDELPLPVEVFAVASIYGLEDLAQRSLRWNNSYGISFPGIVSLSHDDPANEKHMSTDWRSSGLGDLELDLLSRLPVELIAQFSRIYQKVVSTPGYSWIKAGDDF